MVALTGHKLAVTAVTAFNGGKWQFGGRLAVKPLELILLLAHFPNVAPQ
jgi:hypothetical protein